MTSEQLEAARAERMRHNGHGALTLEDARTWIEETGLCLFLPKRQFSSSLAPSFVEAVAGQQNATPDSRQIAIAEDLLVRLERDGVAIRLNLIGHPGEQPDYVVAAWVLPYVYALRGDRDWRRSPQLTGSRQVSPLAIQAYKRLEAGDATIAELTRALGREVSESGVLRAITELWQQLRIIPIVSAPGQPAQWQLLRHRFQKAIAEGASTSQVTAISVLASIYLQAVIAANMEEVEMFLSPLTARSKIREVIRGLVATRQVHTLTLGHAPHYYVAGTLPEFSPVSTAYASSSIGASYFARFLDDDDGLPDQPQTGLASSLPAEPEAHPVETQEHAAVASVEAHRSQGAGVKAAAARSHHSRPTPHTRDRKPIQKPAGARASRHAESRSTGARPASGNRPAANGRFASNSAKHANGTANGNGNSNRATTLNGSHAAPNGHNGSSKPASSTWAKRNGNGSASGKSGVATRSASGTRNASGVRKDSRSDARSSRNGRKPALAAGSNSATKRYGFTAGSKQGTKKRG